MSSKLRRILSLALVFAMVMSNALSLNAFAEGDYIAPVSEDHACTHVEVIDEAVDATCTNTGLTEGKHCSTCGEVLVAQTVVDALGHTEGEAVVENNVTATCTAAGSCDNVTYCTVCGKEVSRETVTVDALGHTEAVAVENNVAATCTTAGSYDNVKYCSACGVEVSRETITVEALGHTEIVDAAKAPTCTETGLTEGKYCSVCGNVLVAQGAVPALGHTAGEAVVENNVAATCTAEGSYDSVVYCTVCNTEISRNTVVVEKAAHTEEALDAKAATCTETGLTAGAKCSVCGEIIIAQEEVAALGHKYVNGVCSVCEALEPVATLNSTPYTSLEEAVAAAKDDDEITLLIDIKLSKDLTIDKEITLNLNGKKLSTAEGVVLTVNEKVKINGVYEEAHVHTSYVAVAPSCTEAGKTAGFSCNKSCEGTVQEVTALGHSYEAAVTAPTCTEAGYTTYTCNCGDSYVADETDALGHTEAEPVVENEVAADCTNNGSYDSVVYCTECNTEISRETIVVPASHTEVVDAAVAATCTETGLTAGKHCSVCNTILVAQEEVAAAHTEGEVVVENEVDATCTKAGSYDNAVYCTACGIKLSCETITVDALGHDYVEGTCSVCEHKAVAAIVASIAMFTADENDAHIINTTYYETLADALDAASAMTGNVTVEIYDKVTLNRSLSGSYDSITFVGKDTDAEIYLDVQGYITATGKAVAFGDLILSKSAGGYITNAGFMNVAFGVYDVDNVIYANCTFANGAYASSGDVTFTGCTFSRSYDKYGLWAYGNVDVTVDGCTFADYRGIKMYAEGAAKTVDLTVKDTDFSAVTDKPAIVLTYGESVTLEDNTYSSTGVFELDLDGAPNGTTISFTDDSDDKLTCVNDNGACGVLVDGKIYTTVTEAAKDATSGSTVTLLHNSTETVELPEGVTLDTNGYTAAGVTVSVPVAQIGETNYSTLEEAFTAAVEGDTITLLADATPALTSQRAITNAAVIDLGGNTLTLTEDDLYFGTTTFKNGTIVVDPSVKPSTAVFWMFANQTLTFDNVKIVATGVTGTYLIGLDGNNSDLNLLNGSEILVENTTALDLDIICVNASTGNDIEINNSKVKVTNLDGRVFFRGNYTVKGNSEIYLDGITKAGFRIEAGQTLSIEDTASVTITGDLRDGGIHLTDLTATYTKADTATVNATVNAPVAVAQIGDTKYGTLQEAVNAVQNGETITLLDDITENVTLTEKVGLYYTIDGANKNMIGTITVKALSDTNDNRRITIKNIKFSDNTATDVSFISAGDSNYYPRLTVDGCTFTGSGNDVAVRLKDSSGAIITNCYGSGLHSFLQNTAGWNLTIEKVIVSNSKSGFALGTVQGVTVKECSITASDEGYGIRIDANTYNNNAVIENCDVEAFIPVVVRKANTASNITFDGTNTMTANNTDGIWCAIGTSEYETNGTMPTAPTGNVVVTLNDSGLDANGIYGNFGRASIDGVKYQTVAAALDAAKTSNLTDVTITLLGEVTKEEAIALDDSFDLYSVTKFNSVTFEQEDPAKTYWIAGLYTGSRTNGGGFVFDGVNIGVTGQYIFEGNVVLKNNSSIDSVAEANCFLYYNTTTIEPGSKLKGVIEDFRGGDMIVDGGKTDGTYNTEPNVQDAIMIVNWSDDKLILKNGAYVKINSANEVGRLTVNNGAAVELTASKLDACQYITLNAGSTLAIDGKSQIVTPKIDGAGTIEIDATGMQAGDVVNITADLSGFTGTLSVTNNNLEAEIEDGKIVLVQKAVAEIGDTKYYTLQDAFKAATSGCTIEILDNVTIDGKWDCRDYVTDGSHSQFKESVIINGNGHTITFTGTINDNNWNTVFRFEENATVTNLTIDISEATGAQRVITAKKSLTVDGLTIIGNAKYGIIFGEGASADDLAAAEIAITNSNLTGTRRAISDNEGGKDVKSVTITDNTLNANAYVSAYETVTFTGNTVTNGYVNIRSYTADNELDVTATDNTLTDNKTETERNYIEAGGIVTAQSEFVLPPYGTLTNAYTSETGYWGECGGNAKESFEFKFYHDDTYMGYTSLNDVDGIIDGDVYISWSIKLDAESNTDPYWTMAWEIQPTIAMQPNRVEQWVDGVKVAEAVVEPNWSDKIFPVVAAVTDADGKILSYVNNYESATLANAFANGGNIVLLKDITLSDTLTIPAGKTVTLDLNGKTISQTKACTESYQMIENNGNLTITGNGKISFTDTGAGDSAATWGSYTIRNAGTLVVENGTIEHLGAQNLAGQAFAHTTLAIFQYSGSTTINGGTISTPNYRSIRLWSGDLTINGGTFGGQVWVHCVNDTAKLTINGGSFSPNGNDGSSVFVNNSGYKAELSITDGTFATRIGADKPDTLNGSKITGGLFTEAAKNGTNLVLLGEGMIFGDTSVNGYYSIVDDPYTIVDLNDLMAFRDSVNSGTDYSGKTVSLLNDINLNGDAWTPIGTKEAPFKGTFDGQDHTISNLNVNGENNVGFFGYADNCAIKNLQIENATVTGVDCVGAVAGQVYSTSTIDNCHVSGSIKIEGQTNVGGIVGKYYVRVSNSSVIGDGVNTSYVKGVYTGADLEGDNIGGIMGHGGESNNFVRNTVKNITISGTRKIGGIVGTTTKATNVSGATVENVKIVTTAEPTYSESKADSMGLGGLIGHYYGVSTGGSITNNTVNNVIFEIPDGITAEAGVIVGNDRTNVGNEPVGVTVSGNNYSGVTGATHNYLLPDVKIGDKLYDTLAEAVAAAQSDDTITLLDDITASEVILLNKSITIEGNDHEVTSSASRVFRVTASDTEVTLNKVNMVSTAVRVGTDDIRGISIDASLSNVQLTLNECSVDFTDASANDWSYAVNITGNGTGHTLTVDGGTYEGANVINVHGANNTVKVENATLTSLYPDNDLYYGACIWVLQENGSSVEANGNTFNGSNAVAFNLGTGTTLTESNNIDNTTMKVAKIGGTYYISLAAAFAAAQENDTITLLQDVAQSEMITVANGSKITLDLNGKTITGTDNTEKNFSIIDNRGELTITDTSAEKTGKITLTATVNSGWNRYSAVIANNPGGKLTVEGGTIEHLGGTDMAYGIDNLTNGKGTYAETVINGGTVKSTYRAIRQFLNGVEAQNILTVNGGTIEGANKSIWMQDPNKNANTGKLTVSAEATLKGDVNLTVTAGSTEWPVEVSIAAAALAEGSEVSTKNVPAGYAVVETNGTYGIRSTIIEVATKAELNAALDAAKEGYTILLTADIDYGTDQLKIEKAITLDLGGKTLTTRYAYGGMSVKNDPTIKNGTIVHASNTAAIKVWNAAAFEDLVIDVQGKGDANKTIGGIVLQSGTTTNVGSIKNVTIKGDALTNGIETYNCGDATENVIGSMENVTIDAKGTGMLISAPCGTATNCSIKGGVNGIEIWIKGNYSASLDLVDCDVTGGVFAHDEFSSDPDIVNNGTLSLNAVGATTGAGVNDITLTIARADAEKVEGVLKDVMDNAVAKVNDTYYQTLSAAVDAANDGDTITLLDDIELDATLTTNKAITIEGNGKTITTSDAFVGNASNAMIDIQKNITFNNVVFDGVKDVAVMRAVSANVVMNNCVVQNCEHTVAQGLFRLACGNANITNSKFLNNECTMVLSFGYDAANETDVLTIDNCVFEDNTCSETAVVYFADGGYAAITNTSFIGNAVESAGNAATLYMGWGSGYKVEGCAFINNTVITSHATTKRFASAIFCDGCTVNGNVFVNNTATRNGEAVPTVVAVAAYYGEANVSGNYWNDDTKPAKGKEFTVEYDRNPVTITTYYTGYTIDENGKVTLTGLKKMPAGKVAYRGYINDAANREAIQIDLENVVAENSLKIELYDTEDNLLTTTTLIAGGVEADSYTCNIVLWGTASSSWDTVINAEKLTVANYPVTAKVYADDTLVDTYENILGVGTNVDELPKYLALDCVYKEAKIGETYYATLQDAFDAANDGDTITILAGELSEGTIKLPADLNNVTFKGEEGAVLKDMTIMASDGNAINYDGLTFDGITFDNSRITITGWRTGGANVKDLTVTNCTFKNLNDTTNSAPVHINMAATEAVENFTFTNNVIDGATGGSKSGIYAQTTGKTTITGNTINNVAFRPYVIQITTDDGIADEFIVTGNTFSGSAAGRAQGLTNNAEGTDNVELVVSENIFKDITNAQQICYWNFNEETTDADLSKNYYDIDIQNNPGGIYFNSAAQNVEDLIEMGIYPYYADEAKTVLVEAPAIMVTYPVGNPVYPEGKVEYYDDMLEAVPYTTNCPRLEGATITLLKDTSGAGMRFMENDMVFDLNGHTYTITAGTGSQGTNTSGFQIRPEVTTNVLFKNGTIKVAEGAPVVWMFNVYATDFIVEDVTVDCTNMAWSYGEQCYVVVSREGDNVQFTGITKIENFNSEVAGSAINVGDTMTIEDTVVPGGTIELDAGATLTAKEGLDVVTVDGYKVVYENGVYISVAKTYVAQIGETKYETLEEALTAAVDGNTIELLWAEGDAPIAMNGAVYGKSVTITGTAQVDWSKDWLYVGRGGEGNGTVIFDKANLTSASDNASTGIHVSGREKNTNNKYDGTLIIKNSTIELDYLINKNVMTLDSSTLTVKNGFSIGGRPASETESGEDATATITLNNNSKVIVNNHNGMGLGYEAIGVMNVDATSSFETTQSFLVTAKGTLNLAGNATITGTLTNNGSIVLTDAAAELTASECGNVTTTVADSKVVYENGVYKVVAKVYVAQIGETKYEMLADAATDIATDGSDTTIKILQDIEVGESIEFNYGTGKVIFTADKPVTVKQTAVGMDFAFTKSYEADIVIDENVTFEIYDNAAGIYLYYGPSLTLKGTITGGQNWGCAYLYNGEHVVEESGMLSTGRVQLGHTEMTVKGEMDTNYLLVEGSTFTADGATIDANVIYDNNNGGQRWGASTFEFKNNTSVKTSKLTLSYADSVMNVDLSSKVEAKELVGAGKIVIDATGFDGNEVLVITGDASGFNGTVEVENAENAIYEITDTGIVVKLKAVASVTDTEGNVTSYGTLEDAINAAQDNDTITLLDNIELTGSVTISGKKLTLDLGGYTITDMNTKVLTSDDAVWGMIELRNGADVTVGNGTMKCNYTNVTGGWTGMAYCIDVESASKLTVNGGSFINGNGGIQTQGEVTVNGGTFVSHNGGTCIMATYLAEVTVNGGTFKDSVEASDVYTGSGAVWAGFGATVNINGGTYDFAADSENGNVVWTLFPAQNAIAGYGENANMSVTGGTFKNFNPEKDVIVDWSASTGFKFDSVVAEGYAALPDLNGNYVVGEKPTATVNDLGSMTIPEDDYIVYNGSMSGDLPLSFVMQFLADQTEEDMETSPYADWYGDFVLTFSGLSGESFTADGCYLAGYYGDFGWVVIPVDGMEIKNGVRYPVMLGVGMGQKYDYICTGVKDFRCALYITPEILEANPNITVNLELSIVDNSQGGDAARDALMENENIKYHVVNSHEYNAEDFAPVEVTLPEVVITDIKGSLNDTDPDLTFALNFAIKDIENLTEEYLEQLFKVYGSWYVDYVLTISGLNDADVTFNANGDADGYLAGQYDAWSENWVSVPFEDVPIENGESIYIMEYAASLMGQSGLRYTLQEVAEIVQNFDCGVYFTPEFLAANPNMEVTLDLKVFTEDEEGNKDNDINVATNEFSAENIAAVVEAENKQSKYFGTIAAAVAAVDEGDTITLVKDAEGDFSVSKNIGLNLNGKTYTGTITLADAEATLKTETDTLKVITDVEDSKVVYEEGVYAVKALAIRFNGASLILQDSISTNYYFSFDDYKEKVSGELADNIGLLFWSEDDYNKYTTHEITNASYIISELKLAKDQYEGQDEYSGRSNGIAAKNMIDMQYTIAYVKLEDNTYVYSDVVEYSPVVYSKAILENKELYNETMEPLVIALMNYGAAAQVRFGYKPESLMNAWMEEDQKNLGWQDDYLSEIPDDTSKFKFTTEETISFYGSSLSLKDTVNHFFYFDIDDSLLEGTTQMGMLYWKDSTYNRVEELTVANVDDNVELVKIGDHYRGAVKGTAAKDLGTFFYACAYVVDENGNYHYSNLVIDGAHSYANAVINGEYEDAMKYLAKAIIVYNRAAVAHFY